ncbi:hypothetical protein SSX86_017344 [Deinandra increscens subsp. villosa]|uniref:Coilin n=1 Tax=Deinandra increscens subsp. villosa TaxID=3103831 RepID=A0AAP0D283_9ASTR
METQSLRIRLMFEDRSVSQQQRTKGMNRTWILIEPNQHPKISDVCNNLLNKFDLRSSCPNGILLFMKGFVLPPSESTRILKNDDIVCVRRNEVALTEAKDGADNVMLLLENEEFDKETGGYQSETEDAVVVKVEEESSPKVTTSKKRKASTKCQSSKKKKHPSPVMDGVEDELATDENRISKKKIKPNEEVKKENAETSDKNIEDNVNGAKQTSTAPDGAIKVPSRSARRKKAKRRWRWELAKRSQNPTHEYANETGQAKNGVSLPQKRISKKIKPNEEIKKENAKTSDNNIKDNVGGVEQASTVPDGAKKLDTHEYINEFDQADNEESLLQTKISKKKIKPNEEIKKENDETNDNNVKDEVEGVKQTSTVPDGTKKVPSRSSRRKKAKRRWRRELAKISHDVKLPAKIRHKNVIKQEEIYFSGDVDSGLVPCAVKSGHTQLGPHDEEGDKNQIKSPDVAFRWNGITNNKAAQKWSLETFSTFERDDTRETTKASSTMLTVDTRIPRIDLIDFDQLPLCSSPKEGDAIAYRVLELSSSWTPELSSFRVGKISYYDGDNIVLLPVPEYPIVFDKMEEDGPDKSLYKEDGSLKIKFADLADVRCVKQSNSDAVKAVCNGVNQTPHGDEMKVASNLMPNSNDAKENLSTDPSPVVENKDGNLPGEIDELLVAKKSELMKKDSGRNKWSYRGSTLGPTMALLRSNNNI